MIETAFVFDQEGRVIKFHTPEGRTAGGIPDTRSLWDLLWDRRNILGGSSHNSPWEGPTGGVAHTHPWSGSTGPSRTDITTFSAVELGLGKRLLWPIVTFTHIVYCVWEGPDQYDYRTYGKPPWSLSGEALEDFLAGIEILRDLSRK